MKHILVSETHSCHTHGRKIISKALCACVLGTLLSMIAYPLQKYLPMNDIEDT
jgi:hypothetical protein